MLSLEHNTFSGETRLLVQTGLVQAWISYYPLLFDPCDTDDRMS